MLIDKVWMYEEIMINDDNLESSLPTSSLLKMYSLVQAKLCVYSGADPGGPQGPRPPLTTKNEAPAPKFYKTEAPEWQF